MTQSRATNNNENFLLISILITFAILHNPTRASNLDYCRYLDSAIIMMLAVIGIVSTIKSYKRSDEP